MKEILEDEDRLLNIGDSDYDYDANGNQMGMVDGPNMYSYAMNNPINLRDPRGRQHWPPPNAINGWSGPIDLNIMAATIYFGEERKQEKQLEAKQSEAIDESKKIFYHYAIMMAKGFISDYSGVSGLTDLDLRAVEHCNRRHTWQEVKDYLRGLQGPYADCITNWYLVHTYYSKHKKVGGPLPDHLDTTRVLLE